MKDIFVKEEGDIHVKLHSCKMEDADWVSIGEYARV